MRIKAILAALFAVCIGLAISPPANAHVDDNVASEWFDDPDTNPGGHVGNDPHLASTLYYFTTGAQNLVYDLDADIPNAIDLADRIQYYDNNTTAIPDLSKGECENTTKFCLNVQKVNSDGNWAIKRDLTAFGIKHGWVRFNTRLININESWGCTMIWFSLQGHPHTGAGCSSVPHPAGVITLTENAEDIISLRYANG